MIVRTKSAHKKLALPLQRMSRLLPAKAKRVEHSKESVDSVRIFFCHASSPDGLKNVVCEEPL
jgi:hypothetical protein